MSPIKLSDVKSHLRAPLLTNSHLDRPESQPDATGFSEADPDANKVGPSAFADDFAVEHSFSGTALAHSNPSIGPIGPQAPATFKSVKS
jgi:hypothetical protein